MIQIYEACTSVGDIGTACRHGNPAKVGQIYGDEASTHKYVISKAEIILVDRILLKNYEGYLIAVS